VDLASIGPNSTHQARLVTLLRACFVLVVLVVLVGLASREDRTAPRLTR
jgi:hypothetical protein